MGFHIYCDKCDNEVWTFSSCLFSGEGFMCSKCETRYRIMFMEITETPLDGIEKMLEGQIKELEEKRDEGATGISGLIRAFKTAWLALRSVEHETKIAESD